MLKTLRISIPVVLWFSLISCGSAPEPAALQQPALSMAQLRTLVDSMLVEQPDRQNVWADSVRRLSDSRTTSILLDHVRTAEPVSRHRAAYLLSHIAFSDVTDTFRLGIRDSSSYVRWATVRAMANYRSDTFDSLLIEVFDDSSAHVRRAAVQAAAVYADTAFFASLERHRLDPAEEVRAAVATALGSMGAKGDSLLLIMAGEERSMVLQAAVRALGNRRLHDAAPVIGVALLDGSADARAAAAEALGKIGNDEAVRLLRAAAADDPVPLVRESAVRALTECSPDIVLQIIRERREVEFDAFVRLAWVQALGRLHTDEARNVLLEMAQNDRNLQIRAAAREELGE